MNQFAPIVPIPSDLPLAPCQTIDTSNIIEGPVEEGIATPFSAMDGAFTAGIWSSTPGKDRIPDFSVDEFCLILEGEICLTDERGQEHHFGPGDAFVVPKGFAGTWQTIKPTRKYFAIFDRNALVGKD